MKSLVRLPHSAKFIVFILMLTFAQCDSKKDDPEPEKEEPKKNYPTGSFTVKNVSSTMFSAKFKYTIVGDQKVSALNVEYSTNTQFQGKVDVSLGTPVSMLDTLRKRITSLAPETKYYLRSAISLADTTIYSPVVEINTPAKFTFVAAEPNRSTGALAGGGAESPQLGFTKNGKGYIFVRSQNLTTGLSEFDPVTENWVTRPVTNLALMNAYFFKNDFTGFQVNNRYFAAFGFSGIAQDQGMSRSVFEISPETGGVTEMPIFNGTNAWDFETITVNNRAFAFTLTFNTGADSINVHEFNTVANRWEHKATLASLRSDLYLPYAKDGNIYIMSGFGGGLPDLFEYAVSSETLTKLPATTALVSETTVALSFSYNGKVYYISRNTTDQFFSVFDPQTRSNTRLATYPKLTDMDRVISAFVLDNVMYTQSASGKYYLIEF